jgi:hypothetical protein
MDLRGVAAALIPPLIEVGHIRRQRPQRPGEQAQPVRRRGHRCVFVGGLAADAEQFGDGRGIEPPRFRCLHLGIQRALPSVLLTSLSLLRRGLPERARYLGKQVTSWCFQGPFMLAEKGLHPLAEIVE